MRRFLLAASVVLWLSGVAYAVCVIGGRLVRALA